MKTNATADAKWQVDLSARIDVVRVFVCFFFQFPVLLTWQKIILEFYSIVLDSIPFDRMKNISHKKHPIQFHLFSFDTNQPAHSFCSNEFGFINNISSISKFFLLKLNSRLLALFALNQWSLLLDTIIQ